LESLDKPYPAKLICGILHHAELPLDAVMEKCEAQWGVVQDHSTSHLFSEGSQYYCEQMGAVHHRYFVSFEGLVDPRQLAQAKRDAIELEQWAAQTFPLSSRPLNLDPGLLMRGRMVLATTKDFSHRVYLGLGIYAEVTLMFKKKGCEALPWTYPDIRQGHYDAFFIRAKDAYLAESNR
jgi:hypothetical protein